ncbi:MAG: OmpH family outer membrane protein [Alphaproteobacteria bacterium]|nr:OmpH family outer membrane protein [Alphaproteobacteria bacterium]
MRGLRIVALALGLIGVGLPTAAQQRLAPAAIAVLDFQRVLRESAAGADIRRQMEGLRKRLQDDVAKEEQGLKAAEQSLLERRAQVSREQFEDARRDLERRMVDAQRRAQDQARDLDRSFNGAAVQVQAALVPIVQDLARANGFSLVIDKSQALVVSNAVDLTGPAIQQLNQRLPAVKVVPPAN